MGEEKFIGEVGESTASSDTANTAPISENGTNVTHNHSEHSHSGSHHSHHSSEHTHHSSEHSHHSSEHTHHSSEHSHHSSEHSHHSSHSSSRSGSGSSHRHRSHSSSHGKLASLPRKLRRSKFVTRIRELWQKFKKSKNRVSITLALALALIMIVSITIDVVSIAKLNKSEKEENGANAVTSDVLKTELINGEGILVTEPVGRYLGLNLTGGNYQNVKLSDLNQQDIRVDVQKPVEIKLWTEGDLAHTYKIEYSQDPELKDATVDYKSFSEGTYTFEHLYTNTTYYYRVTAYTTGGLASVSGQFVTSDTPRFLTIDGAYNVRDIGNWRTDSGRRIKQGLLYRGTEIDGAVEAHYHITNDGLYDMLNVLGIKYDMDLRNEADTPFGSDALGSRVEHKYYNSPMYAGIFSDEGKIAIKTIFTDLANKNNYPMYLHCTYGCDRTGTVCYLLEALLGVSEGDCLRDYGLSNMPISNILAVKDQLDQNYGASTLKEQVELYLLDCGISITQINTIRDIFLGE